MTTMREGKAKKKSGLTATQKTAATAGMLAALAPAAAAPGDIIYIDDQPISASAFGVDGFTTAWDVDGANGVDFELRVRQSSNITDNYFSSNSYSYFRNVYGILRFSSAGQNGRGLVGTTGGIRAFGLAPSVNVGPTLSAAYQWGLSNVSYRNMARYDSFTSRTQPGGGMSTFFGSGVGVDFVNFFEGPNFLGFRFDILGSTHYGWAQIDFTGANVTISRWAYESDADTAIHVGAIPEPNSFALLGLGAAGVLAWRQRKKTATEG